jgi:hypothetical protein
VRRVVSDVRLLYVRDEVVGEVDNPESRLHQRRVPRGCKHALDAGDVRSPFQPLVRVPAEHVALVVEALDTGERAGPDRVRVRPGGDVADLAKTCSGTIRRLFARTLATKVESRCLESSRDLVLSHELDRNNPASRPRETDLIHRPVAPACR